MVPLGLLALHRVARVVAVALAVARVVAVALAVARVAARAAVPAVARVAARAGVSSPIGRRALSAPAFPSNSELNHQLYCPG
jgi:hypothetical protein